MAFIKNIQGARITGSITASFTGDGSGLTGIVSASNADTASYVDLVAGTNITINQVGTTYTINSTGGGGSAFPYTGSAIISGSLQVTGSTSISGALTAAGLTYPTTDGDAGDIIFTDGAGNLTFGRTTVFANVKNITSGTLQKGTPVHVTGSVGNANEIVPSSASVALTMPAHFILNEDITAGSEGKAIAIGYINGVNTSGFIEGDTVYVGASGGYTNVKPTGSNLIQNLGIVTKIDATNGSGYVLGAGRSNDVPNITAGYVWIGNSNGVATPTATSSIQNVISSSYATTASYATYAVSASYEINYETSSSYAETASFVPAGVGGLYGGDGTISLNTTAAVAGNLLLSGSNGTQSGSTLSLYGSGSANPVFKVDGSAGELFSISDSLSGSLFAINNISGLSIFEVFSDDQILYGGSTAPALTTTVKNTVSATGAFTVYSLPTASYDGAWFEYVVKSGSNARAGQIMAVWSGSQSNISETTTTDIGSTTAISFYGLVSGSNFVLTGSATTANWTVKTIVRSI